MRFLFNLFFLIHCDIVIIMLQFLTHIKKGCYRASVIVGDFEEDKVKIKVEFSNSPLRALRKKNVGK